MRGLGGLLTPGLGALCPTTTDDLADSDNGESCYQSVDRTPLGDGADPCGGHWYEISTEHCLGGGIPEKMLTPGCRAPCFTTTEDSVDSDNGKSGCQSVDRPLRGDCAEHRGGHWYGVSAGCSCGGSRSRSLCTPRCRAPHSTTNRDSADSDNGKSRYLSPDRTPRSNGAEPCGGCWYEVPARSGHCGSRPEKLSTAGCRATYSTINKDLASSTEDNGDKDSTSSQGLEDGNDLGLSGDGAALRCSGEAVFGSLAANVDQDKKISLRVYGQALTMFIFTLV